MPPMRGLLTTPDEADPTADILARLAKLEQQMAGLLSEEAQEPEHGGDPTDGATTV